MRLRQLLCLALLVAAPAFAQDKPPQLEPLPDVPPPPENLQDEGTDPEVTITTRGEEKVEEYRINGHLYMVKVIPKVGEPYYLVDSKGDGVFSRYDPSNKQLSVPMWVIKRW